MDFHGFAATASAFSFGGPTNPWIFRRPERLRHGQVGGGRICRDPATDPSDLLEEVNQFCYFVGVKSGPFFFGKPSQFLIFL